MAIEKTASKKERVREAMAQYHGRSNVPGLIAAVFDCGGYACCFWMLATRPSWTWGIPLAVVQMMFIARLFILGHDACHGALFQSRFWNRLLGRVFFLPSMTPYSLWEFGHNTVHHGFSNLRGRDYVWIPFSPQDWLGLSVWRRRLERLYRRPLGLGAYYFYEIWWKRLFFPQRRSMTSNRTSYFRDNVLNAAILVLQAAVVLLIAPSGAGRLGALWLTLVLPFVLWNYLMGFAIYCHHTHPDIKWFDSRAEWGFYEAQVCSTTHTSFPWGIGWLLHNIFEHTAHHVDTGIPFYNLRAAQGKLEELCGPDIVRVEVFSPLPFLARVRQCQLYDYENHHWGSFEATESVSRR